MFTRLVSMIEGMFTSLIILEILAKNWEKAFLILVLIIIIETLYLFFKEEE